MASSNGIEAGFDGPCGAHCRRSGGTTQGTKGPPCRAAPVQGTNRGVPAAHTKTDHCPST